MIVQLEVRDDKSDFLLNLLSELKSSIKNIKIIKSKSLENEQLKMMTDQEKWEKYGNWDPDEDADFKLAQHRYIFDSLEKEFGSENYKKWQK